MKKKIANFLINNGEVEFVFSKKATKFDKIFTVDLTLTTYCQIDGEDFVNLCGLLRKHKLYQPHTSQIKRSPSNCYYQKKTNRWLQRTL